MREKLKALGSNPRFKEMPDKRTLGLYVFIAAIVLVSWNGMKVIQDNYVLQREIAKLEQEDNIAQLENENQRLSNEYLNTDQFLELAARRQFGKAAPGETVIAVPKEVAKNYIAQLPKPEDQKSASASQATGATANVQAWIDFILHRQND